MMQTDPNRFTHTVESAGPAQGMTFAGRQRLGTASIENQDVPLIVAIHGGGYSSAYFDVPGYSLLDRAESLNIPIIAIDRPAYGGSDAVEPGDSIFLANAEVLDHLIAELWEKNHGNTTGIVVIGHSFGAVVASAIAARKPSWPLLGIAISGCLVRVPEGTSENWAPLPDLFDVPTDLKTMLMFGKEWTRRADMPQASIFANVPVLKAELVESSNAWNQRLYPKIMPAIEVPVHLRHGEFDALWVTDENQVAEFAAALTSSPSVDAKLFRSAGHAIDFERGGAALQAQQLAFALDLVAQAISEK